MSILSGHRAIFGHRPDYTANLPFASKAFNEHATSEVLCVWITDPAGRSLAAVAA